MAKRLIKSAGCGNVIGISTETSPDDRELRLIWEIPVKAVFWCFGQG